VKGQKKETLTRPESRHSSRPDVFYFLPTAHFLKQLPTHNSTFAFAPTHEANPSAKSKEPFFLQTYTSNELRGVLKK
jgi:hypothetical protein